MCVWVCVCYCCSSESKNVFWLTVSPRLWQLICSTPNVKAFILINITAGAISLSFSIVSATARQTTKMKRSGAQRSLFWYLIAERRTLGSGLLIVDVWLGSGSGGVCAAWQLLTRRCWVWFQDWHLYLWSFYVFPVPALVYIATTVAKYSIKLQKEVEIDVQHCSLCPANIHSSSKTV